MIGLFLRGLEDSLPELLVELHAVGLGLLYELQGILIIPLEKLMRINSSFL